MVEVEREEMKAQMSREREEFEKYKSEQLTKMKNERRVWERQAKSSAGGANLQKEKEEVEHIRHALEKEREDFKKKDKNNKIMMEKYKKEAEELRNRVERLEMEKESLSSRPSQSQFSNEEFVLDNKKTVNSRALSANSREEAKPKDEKHKSFAKNPNLK